MNRFLIMHVIMKMTKKNMTNLMVTQEKMSGKVEVVMMIIM